MLFNVGILLQWHKHFQNIKAMSFFITLFISLSVCLKCLYVYDVKHFKIGQLSLFCVLKIELKPDYLSFLRIGFYKERIIVVLGGSQEGLPPPQSVKA